MSDLTIAIYATIVGTLASAAILTLNTFVWQKRYWIKSRWIGWYERRFGTPAEAKYTVGASEYIKGFKTWHDPTEEGISLMIPSVGVEFIYDNVIAVRLFRNEAVLAGRGNMFLIVFRDDNIPKSKHIIGLTDSEVHKVARRIYFQSVVGSRHEKNESGSLTGD